MGKMKATHNVNVLKRFEGTDHLVHELLLRGIILYQHRKSVLYGARYINMNSNQSEAHNQQRPRSNTHLPRARDEHSKNLATPGRYAGFVMCDLVMPTKHLPIRYKCSSSHCDHVHYCSMK